MTTKKKVPTKADALEERVDKVEGWLGGQGIDVGPFGAVPEPPRKLTLEERIARLELAATSNGFTL